MSENKIEINKLTIQLGKREIELSMEDAKKLKDALDGLFGKEIIKEIHHDHYPYRWWYGGTVGKTTWLPCSDGAYTSSDKGTTGGYSSYFSNGTLTVSVT